MFMPILGSPDHITHHLHTFLGIFDGMTLVMLFLIIILGIREISCEFNQEGDYAKLLMDSSIGSLIAAFFIVLFSAIIQMILTLRG
jgi:hypothetical protein